MTHEEIEEHPNLRTMAISLAALEGKRYSELDPHEKDHYASKAYDMFGHPRGKKT